MCGVIDDALPAIGAIVGGLLTSESGGWGAALGAGLGGATSGYAQTHNWGDALEQGGIAGGTAFAGSALGSLASTGIDSAANGAFSNIGTGVGLGADTTGGLESGAGGAALFGPSAGTGTAIGSGTSGALGGGSLGIAGNGALSGVGSSGLGYLSGMGGSTAGTGLGLGGANSASDLNGVMNGTSGGIAGGTTPTTALGNTSPIAGAAGNPSPAGSSLGAVSNTGVAGNASPMAFDQTGGAQFTDAAAQGAAPDGSLSSLYGPSSVAGGSPQGALIAQAGETGTGGQGVQFGALGQGTAASNSGGLFGDGSTTSSILGQLGNNGSGAASPLHALGVAGLDALQQYAKQNAANNYRNSIQNIFSPTGAYAQQMNSNIQRQYAAQGRRAEVGPQQVQLAAALAQAQAQALGGNNYANAAQNTSGANILNGLFTQPGAMQGLTQLGKQGWNGLSSLFSD